MQSSAYDTIGVQCLGQTGYRLQHQTTVLYIDPYLSNSVQENEGKDLARMRLAPVSAGNVEDADWVLVTHEHRDHCDLDTLIPISLASKSCKFLAPASAARMIEAAGVSSARIVRARRDQPVPLGPSVTAHPVPSAHPVIELDPGGWDRWLGYVIRFGGRHVYHAGDTSVDSAVVDALREFDKIDVAFLPVNEKNYYRDRRGIVGNMSVREAFQFAEEIHAGAVVPTHWDMFDQNCTYREEIELLYAKMKPSFDLVIEPDSI